MFEKLKTQEVFWTDFDFRVMEILDKNFEKEWAKMSQTKATHSHKQLYQMNSYSIQIVIARPKQICDPFMPRVGLANLKDV